MSAGALADTNTSIANPKPAIAPGLLDNYTLTYFGVYRGASVNDPGNQYQPNLNGTLDTDHTQSMENYITAGYKLDKDTTVGVSAHFYYAPNGMPETLSNSSLEMLDPSLVIGRANMIKAGTFSMTGKVFMDLPLSQYDTARKNGFLTSFSPTGIFNYDVPGTKLSIGMYDYLSLYVPGPNTPDAHRVYKFYVAPTANYQLTKTVAATLWVDLIQGTHNTQTNMMLTAMHNEEGDIEPGINWEFLPGYNFNPQVNIYPSNPTLNATSFQAVVTGKFL